MAGSSKRPGHKASDDHEDDFGGNALTELMTGAYAATSMVAMSVDPDEDIPALPEWEPPTTKPPSAELLDDAGRPRAIDSGEDFLAEDDADFDIDSEEDAPALSGSLLQSGEEDPLDPEPAAVSATASPAPEVRTELHEAAEALSEADLSEADLSEDLSVKPSVPPREAYPSLSTAPHADSAAPPAAAPEPPPQQPQSPGARAELPIEPNADSSDDEPLATISAEPGVVVRAPRAPATDFTGSYEAVAAHIRSPSPKPSKNPWPRVLGVAGALGVVALIGWAWTQTANAPAPDAAPQVAPASAAATKTDTKTDTKDAPTPSPAPEVEEVAEPPAADVSAAKAYAAAKAEYDKTEAHSALITMVESACQLEDGPTARAAFRKLVGSKSRSRALITCRELGVDVTAEVEGFTASELADQAQIALDAGKAGEALELARNSNRTARNDHALRLIVMSSCKLGKRQGAKKMLRHIAERKRRPVVEFCATAGIKL